MSNGQTTRILTENAWAEEYNWLGQDVGPLDLDSPIIGALDPHHIWTYADSGDGRCVTMNGFHRVNRIGYFITEKPCKAGDVIAVEYDDEPDDEDAEPVLEQAAQVMQEHRPEYQPGVNDAEPRLVRRDRHKGFVRGNVEVMSAKAAHLIGSYTKSEIVKRIAANNPVPGFSLEELQRAADWMVS